MKKMLVFLSVLTAALALTGCKSSYVESEATSTRYKNVSILEKTNGTSNGYKIGGIEISIDSVSPNAMIYAMVIEQGATAPTNSELKKGKYTSGELIGAYNGKSSLYVFIDDEQFTQGKSYDCYAVIENDGFFSEVTYSTTVHTYLQENLVDKGSGTLKDPYLVSTVEDLEAVCYATSTMMNAETAYYKLTNNIDLTEKYNQEAYDAYFEENGEYKDGFGSWLPLGQQAGSRRKFYGVFDGNGYTINGLFQRTAIEGSGLFSELDASGIIMNLTLTNVDISTTTQRTSAVCGYSKGTITGVIVLGGTVTSTANRLGGIVGQMYEAGHIIASYADVDVLGGTSSGDVGGIVGGTTAGSLALTISDCQFTGNVTGGTDVGGIGGDISGTNVKNNSVFGADVYGTSNTAGVIGKYSSGSTASSGSVMMETCFIYNSIVRSTGTAGYVIRNFSGTVGYNSENQATLYYSGVTVDNGSSSVTTTHTTQLSTDVLLSTEFLQNTMYFSSKLYTFDGSGTGMPILTTAYVSKTDNEFLGGE